LSNEVTVVQEQPKSSMLSQFALPTDSLASVQVAAQARAIEVLSKIMVASSAPRNLEAFRQRMLEVARDPAFAEQAVSIKPIGKGVEVKSVYMAKYMAVEYGHITHKTIDHGGKLGTASQVECIVNDVQGNGEASVTVTVQHVRYSKNNGNQVVSDPDGVRMLVKSESSKTLRNCIFDILHPGITQEVFEACIQTLDISAAEFLKDPDAAIKFFEEKYKVKKGQIFNFLRIDGPDKLTPKHIRRLRALATAFKDGDANPADIWQGAVDIPTKEQEVKQRGRRNSKKEEKETTPEVEKATEQPISDTVKGSVEPDKNGAGDGGNDTAAGDSGAGENRDQAVDDNPAAAGEPEQSAAERSPATSVDIEKVTNLFV
jgi:hypothetical protein